MIRWLVFAVILVVAATIQVAALAGSSLLGAEPDLLLVTLVALALARGAVAGAVGGFVAGLLVDVMTLGTLGITSVVLTVAGFWAGQYGETTGRGRAHAASLAAAALTALVLVGGGALQALIGEPVAVGSLVRSLVPSAVLAALIVVPVSGGVRLLLGARAPDGPSREIELAG